MTPNERVLFPCKTCRHFHRGTIGPALKIGQYGLNTVVDNGCIEDECHCGKITPEEMLPWTETKDGRR